jgi:hypothetical protein
MANSDKNIRIITNKNKSSLPNITFTGYNNDPVVLNVLDDNTISFEGSSGQLFSVSNSVTSGTIFSVNDISGIPSFRIDADGTVGIAEFTGNVGIGLQSPQSKLSVGGDINASIGYSYRINGTMVLNASSLGTGVTLSALTSVGTVSSGTWQGSPIGVIYGGTGGSSASDARSILGAATAGTNSDLTRLLGVQHLFVTIPTAAAIGITVKAAVSQSASLMEFVNSSNSPMSWITKDGTFAHGAYFTHSDGRIPGISVQRSNAAGIVARGFNSDAFPAIEVQNNGGGLGVGLYPGGLVYGGVLQAYSSTGSTNTTTGALIVAGGAGIAGSLNTSTSFSSSISGLRILNASLSSSTGTIAATNKIQVTVSDSDAFLVRNGGGTNIFDIDTSNSVISVLPSTGSTNSSTGALVVTGGVGIGGTANIRSAYVYNDLLHVPGTGNTFGLSFTSFTLPTGFTGALYAIYAENKFVATGGSVVAYSDDSINWTTSYIPWNGAVSNQSITYGNGVYVVTSSTNSYVAYSRDLSTWTLASVTYQNYQTAAYGNGRFVINAGTVVGISTNGANWSSVTPTGSQPNYQALKFQNGYFYSSGSRSVDGIAWEPLNISVSVGNISYGNGLYFGAQYNSSNYAYSYDGVNFTAATIANNVYVGTEYHNGVYYLRTQHNNAILYYSTDGFNYQGLGFGGVGQFAMAFGKNKIVIFGRDGSSGVFGYYAEGTNGKIDLNPIREGNIDNTVIGIRIPKPANFTDISSTGYVNIVNQAGSVSNTTGALVVRGGVGIGQSVNIGGKLDVSNTINYTATNSGIANTWTRIAIPSPVSISGLTYGNGLYVGVGYSAATSTDGITWTARVLPHNLTTVKYGNNLYVGVNYGSALGATSTDGITWRSMSLPSSANWDGIAYGNGIYVITATYNNNLVAYSYNGFQWTLGSLPIPGGFFILRPVIFGGGYFLTGSNAGTYNYTSVDGINWTQRVGQPAYAANNSTYGDGAWVTSGSSASLMYTKDFINWTVGGHYGWSGQANYPAYTNGTFAIVDGGSLQCTLIYKDLSTVVLSNLPGPSYATTITAGEGKFVAGAGSTVYVTDVATHTFNIFPHNSGELNNVRIGAKFPSSGQFTVLSTSGLASVGSSAGSASTSTGALVVKGGVGIGGSLFVGNTLSVGSSIASTSATSGALIVAGGVGIGGSVYTDSSISVGTLSAPSTINPVYFALAGVASTGNLLASTTYYYKISAIDYTGGESLPSNESSVTLTGSQNAVRVTANAQPGVLGYRIYRTASSGIYTTSYIATTYPSSAIANINQALTYHFYDYGITASAIAPLSTSTFRPVSINRSTFSNFGNVNIHRGNLNINTPNYSTFTNEAIEVGNGNQIFVKDHTSFYLGSLTASTGGTLTDGTTYYYKFSAVDFYNNETFTGREFAATAGTGGAITLNFAGGDQNVAALRIYRSTTPGNFTNSYLGQFSTSFTDINYPTSNTSPPTVSSARALYLNSRYEQESFIPNIKVTPGGNNGNFIKTLGGSPDPTVTTSGTAGSLIPGTTYYYKAVVLDIFGNSAFQSNAISVGIGTFTSINVGVSGVDWPYGYARFLVFRSTNRNNFSNSTYYILNPGQTYNDVGDAGYTGTPSSSDSYKIAQIGVANYGFPSNYLRNIVLGTGGNSDQLTAVNGTTGLPTLQAATGGTLVNGQTYYYRVESQDVFNYSAFSSPPVKIVADSGGAVRITFSGTSSQNMLNKWSVFRSTSLTNWSNSLLQYHIAGTAFTDYGWATIGGSPNDSSDRSVSFKLNSGRMTLADIRTQGFFIRQDTVYNITSTPGIGGSLLNNSTYYYRIAPISWGNYQSMGQLSDEIVVSTGSTQNSITLSWNSSYGACAYDVYRTTTRGNYSNVPYYTVTNTSFVDNGQTTLTKSASFDVFYPGSTKEMIHSYYGNNLSHLTIAGESSFLKYAMRAPRGLSATTGSGGTLPNNTTYFYVVEAYDYGGSRTLVSNPVQVDTGANNAITLSWNEVLGASYYKVYRNESLGSFTNSLINVVIKSNSFTDINYPVSNTSPQTNPNYAGSTLFVSSYNNNYSLFAPRTIIQGVPSTQGIYVTDFLLKLAAYPARSIYGSLLELGDYINDGYNGSSDGTYLGIASSTGFSGDYVNFQASSVSRFKINNLGNTTIGSTTGSGSTSTGALIITGGVGIGQSLFTSPSYASSISGAIFSNGSATLSGTYTQNNSSTTAFAVRNAGGTSILNVDTTNSIVSVLASVASTNTSTGALVVSGGVGISGQLSFSRASFGFTGITSNPTMAFIGNTTSSPINLTVLTDNSLSWEGSSGQLFSIDNNLTSGEIFSVSDISGLPIISASAGQTVAINEFGGFTRIGNGSVSSTGASNTGANGTFVVYGGVGITGNVAIGGTFIRSSWTVGETISTSMYNNTDLNMSATTTINSTTYTNIATITYIPKSLTSYLWIEFDAHYDFSNGSTADDFFSRITVGGSAIAEKNQIFINAVGGGTRSATIFPISGRYTNSTTSGIAITIQAKWGSADDAIRVYGSSTSGYMRIQEIGR